MHFQQAADRELLGLRDLHSLPTVQTQPQAQSWSFNITLLGILLSLPVLQIAAESAGLPPVWATCFALLVAVLEVAIKVVWFNNATYIVLS
ncbi:hypothetical protein F4803DRAFT_502098 [Xylaria telfairii]|nr:hypothetical protein F4803DRAFT_502098 [Xylaria telfairii]